MRLGRTCWFKQQTVRQQFVHPVNQENSQILPEQHSAPHAGQANTRMLPAQHCAPHALSESFRTMLDLLNATGVDLTAWQ